MPRALPCKFEPYREIQIEEVLDMLRVVMGETHAIRLEPPYWIWKHHRNPFGASYGILCYDSFTGEIAGLRVMMRWEFRNPDGQMFRAVRAVDTATHPAYRRRGIFAGLTAKAVDDLKEEGVHFIFNTPNEKSRPGYLKLGWKVVGIISLFVRVHNWGRFILGLTGRLSNPGKLPPWETYFGQTVQPWKTFVQNYGLSLINHVVQRWEKERKWQGLRTPRDGNYYQWRYGEHPYIPYGVLPILLSGRLEGFLVFRPNVRFGLREIVLTDFVLPPEVDLRRLKSLLKRSVKGDYCIAHAAQGTVERDVLKAWGFLPVPRRGMVLTFRSLNVPEAPFLNLNAWDLTLGDLELF